jgi:hypothetical protein
MAVYRGSATAAKYWHITSSWVTASSLATPPSSWVTASIIPTSNDDVYLHGTFHYDARITPMIDVRSLNAASGSAQPGALYIHGIDPATPFKIIAPYGISGSSGGSAIPLFQFETPEGAGNNSNCTIHISASIHGPRSTNGSAYPIIGVRNALLLGYLNISISGSCSPGTGYTGAAATGWLATLNNVARNITININGDITGSSSANGLAIFSSNTGSMINITGNILSPAGTSTTAHVVSLIAPYSSVNIVGNIETRGSSSAIAIAAGQPNYITIYGDIIGSATSPAISASIASDTEVLLYGNVRNSGSQNAIFAPKVYITSSALLTIATGSVVSATRSFFQQTSNYTYPAEWDVYQNVSYGNGQTGTMTVPSASNVRNAISYSSGSSISINNTNGTCAIPSASHVRLGVLVDVAPTGGLMVVPIASQVSASFGFESYNVSGSYSGSKTFWATPHTTMTTGIGALISQSLNVRAGSVTGSLIGLLDTDTSNVVTRLQSIAGVADVGNALTASYNI